MRTICAEGLRDHGRARWTCLLVAVAFGFVITAKSARACEDLTVRDAAFNFPRDVHHLCVIAGKNDPAGRTIRERLGKWLATSGAGLNLDLVQVDANDPKVRWQRYGLPSAPPTTPVVVLSGHRETEETGFFIDHWEPEPSEADLEAMTTSPARKAIRTASVKDLAVLLYVPGSGADAGQAKQVISKVASTWSEKTALGVTVIRADRTDRRERLLLSFIGLAPEGPEWVGVIFGRGKFMSPLTGAEITEGKLGALLEAVAGECTCVRTMASYGVDIPMIWNKKHDEALVYLRPPVAQDAESASIVGEKAAEAADALLDTVIIPADPPGSGGRVFGTTALAIGGFVLGLGIATLSILRRRQRTGTASLGD